MFRAMPTHPSDARYDEPPEELATSAAHESLLDLEDEPGEPRCSQAGPPAGDG